MIDNQQNKIQLRFKAIRKHFEIGQVEFAKKSGLTQSQVSEIEGGKRNITPAISILLEDNLNIDRKWLETGVGDMFKSNALNEPAVEYKTNKPQSNAILIGEINDPDDESPYYDLGNGQFIMVVPIVPIKAQAGYIKHYYDEQYISENFTQKHSFAVSRVYRGKYMAFINEGHSMDNGVAGEAILEGSTVTGREIQKVHWRNKFHIHRYKDYVIVHQDGIFTKRITHHDTEKGIITCHSLNPDKELYPDFDLNLDECLQILNIVNVTDPR